MTSALEANETQKDSANTREVERGPNGILEPKNTITEIKSSVGELSRRIKEAEEGISELEDGTMEAAPFEQQRESRLGKKRNRQLQGLARL